jgi:pimeloyl-ACP methyl ester carboxylesterase
MQENDLPVNGARLHYYRTGGDRPPLVLAHGWTNSALCWSETVRALEADYDLILYDARGHGQSARLGERFGEGERAGDLIGLIEALGLKKPGLLGHSMGAATVANVAASRPDLAGYVVLEDPPWYDAAPARDARTEEWARWIRSLPGKSREVALAEYRAQNPLWSDETLNLRLDAFLQMDMRVVTDIVWDLPPWRELVARIQCPLLLVIGEPAREGIVSPEKAREAATLWRSGRWAQIAGAGHNVRYEQFDAYIRVVREFLREAVNSKQ